jgi:hypothetical protein
MTYIPLFSTSFDPDAAVAVAGLAKGVNVHSVSLLSVLSSLKNSGVLMSLNSGILISTFPPLRYRIFLVSAANLEIHKGKSRKRKSRFLERQY